MKGGLVLSISVPMLSSVPKLVNAEIIASQDSLPLLTAEQGTGEILSDRKPNGKERPWKTYKRLGTFLYQLYGRARERSTKAAFLRQLTSPWNAAARGCCSGDMSKGVC